MEVDEEGFVVKAMSKAMMNIHGRRVDEKRLEAVESAVEEVHQWSGDGIPKILKPTMLRLRETRRCMRGNVAKVFAGCWWPYGHEEDKELREGHSLGSFEGVTEDARA